MISLSKIRVGLFKYLYHSSLHNKTISIVSNNCWGGLMSQYLGIPYNSPFVGMFMYSDDYVKLLGNISLIYTEFEFITHAESKYRDYLPNKEYPIGILGDDIELHFLHYSSQEEVITKWKRRLKRFDTNNMIIKSCEQNLCTTKCIENFDRLSFENKVFFTIKDYPYLHSTCRLPEFDGKNEIVECWLVSNQYWNIVEQCNRIKGIKTTTFEKIKICIANKLLTYEFRKSNKH